MKIYLNQVHEDWVVDRFRSEWYQSNIDISTEEIKESNIIWIIAPWVWKKIPKKELKNKFVVCTIHHVEELKMDKAYLKDFYERDKFVDYYHVISDKTRDQLLQLTNKKIFNNPFWVNKKIFYEIKDKESLKNKYKLNNHYLIGSFQRDSESKNLSKPKIIKGPDRLVEIYKYYKIKNKNLKLILTGKRRDYLVDQLLKNKIDFQVYEMVDFEQLNELYNCLDLYIVASRIEGGPQAILECAISKTPIISTDVGIASQILSKKSIFNMNNYQEAKPDIISAYTRANQLIIPSGMVKFKIFFKDIMNSLY